VTREGPFWDVMEGRATPPPAATLLGWELVEVDPEAGTIEVAFTASEQFLNPVGAIQGGFLAAMLDDTLGPAELVVGRGPDHHDRRRRAGHVAWPPPDPGQLAEPPAFGDDDEIPRLPVLRGRGAAARLQDPVQVRRRDRAVGEGPDVAA
jgi:hypothetical protein